MKNSSKKQTIALFRTQNPGLLIISRNMLLFSSVLISHLVCADVWKDLNGYEYQDNEGAEEYVWKEGGNDTPDYPQENDLLEVAGPPAYSNYQYLIDGKNLQVNKDGVVRYSIVIRSPGGTDNVRYEGLRCTSSQVKSYAYGSTGMDGSKTFTPWENADWKPVSSNGALGYTGSLVENYFCDNYGAILKRNEIIHNIKYGKGQVDGIYY